VIYGPVVSLIHFQEIGGKFIPESSLGTSCVRLYGAPRALIARRIHGIGEWVVVEGVTQYDKHEMDIVLLFLV